MGHCNFTVVQNVLNECNISYTSQKQFCAPCIRGKLHQLPFHTSVSQYTEPLQLIFIDIWGPAPVCASNGARYYISFLDAHTKYTWLFLLHNKSQALNSLIRFKTFAENQTDFKLRAVQTDNAKEFLCFKSFTQLHGIFHRFTCPHTHEQNGSIERKHKHISDMDLTLLVVASLPIKLWGEAFTTTTYLNNILPFPVLQNKSPHVLLFHTAPNYTRLKTFGCACYPLLRPYNKHKLDFKFACFLFLGYNLHNRGYICLSPTGKIYMSRHVVFNENVFPCNIPEYNFTPTSTIQYEFDCSNHHITVLRQTAVVHLPAAHNNTESSSFVPHDPLPSPSLPLAQTNNGPTNEHSMTTRSKAGIFKPKSFMSHVNTTSFIPTSIKEALSSTPWLQAMTDEYTTLINNHTWSLTSLPVGAKVVGCKWLFKNTYNADGFFQHHKAMLVAKGFSQTVGTDFTNT